MDIGALLAEAAEETYNAESFEAEEPSPINLENVSAADILKQSAQIVAKEDKEAADRAFAAATLDIKEEIVMNSPRKEVVSSREAEDILLQASKDVSEHYAKVVEPPSDEEPEDDEDVVYDPEQSEQLLLAAFNGKVEGARTCLKNGAHYCCRDRHGWTPLIWAASKGYDDVVEVLLRHLKSQNKNIRGFVNMSDTICGWTALHAACINGHLHTVELLLKNKADKNKLTMMQEKPIDCIGKFRSARSIRMLLEDKVPDSSAQEEKRDDARRNLNKTDNSRYDEYKDDFND